MANRSDFYNTSQKCPRLPRYLKKLLALNSQGAHKDGEVRRMFIDAHQTHVAYKMKRNANEDVVDTSEAE